jgi:fructuronate reductase
MAPRLREAAGSGRDAAAVVDGLLGVTEVFGDDLRDSGAFRESLVGHVKGLLAESGRAG